MNTSERKIDFKYLHEQFSLDDLISIFSELQSKLKVLAKDTDKVFLLINKKYQDYYKYIQSVLNNIDDVHAQLDEKKHLQFFENLSNFFSRGSQDIRTNKLSSISELLNFSPEILHENALDDDSKLESKMFSQIVSLTDKLIKIITSIKEEQAIRTYNQDDEVISEFLKYIDEIKMEVLIVRHSIYSDIQDLKIKTNSCLKTIRDLLTTIQYQDIAGQKLNHIVNSLNELIIALTAENGSQSENEKNNSGFSKLTNIPELSSIYISQLIQSKNEYIRAFSEIKQYMEKIAKTNEHKQHVYDNLRDSFGAQFNQLSKIDNQISVFLNQEMAVNSPDATDTSNQKNSILNHLEDLIKKSEIVKEKLRSKNEANLIDKLSILSGGLLMLKEYLSQFLIHNSPVQLQAKSILKDKFTSSETQGIQYAIKSLAQSYQFSQGFLIENEKLMVVVSKLVEEAIEKVNETSLFNSEFEHVINELSNLSICETEEDYNIQFGLSLIDSLKSKYTMESERFNHNKLLSNQYINDIGIDLSGKSELSEGDIELF